MTRFMKLVQIIKKTSILILIFVLLVISAPAYVRASSKINMSKLGSITIDLSKSKETVTGMSFTIYKIAGLLNTGDYELTSEFVETEVKIDSLTTASQVAASSRALANYVVRKNITGTTSSVDTKGIVKFDQLTLGCYLVVPTGTINGQKVSATCDPFLLLVPMAYTNGSGWLYNVLTYPKTENNHESPHTYTNPDPVVPDNHTDPTKTTDPSNTGVNPVNPTATPTAVPPTSVPPTTGEVDNTEQPVVTEDPQQPDPSEEADINEDMLPGGAPDVPENEDNNNPKGSSSTNDSSDKQNHDSLMIFDLPKTGGSIAYALCKYLGILLISCGIIIFIGSRIKKRKIR